MKIFRFLAPALVLLAGIIASSTVSQATQEFMKKEKKPCTTCHVKANSKELNDTGKYYKEHKSLEGAPAKK